MQPSDQLKTAFAAVFRVMNEESGEQKEHDFVFHLTESVQDLAAFADLCRNPDRYTPEETKKIVAAVLYHAAGHLAQAARLYDYFADPFKDDDKRAAGPKPER